MTDANFSDNQFPEREPAQDFLEMQAHVDIPDALETNYDEQQLAIDDSEHMTNWKKIRFLATQAKEDIHHASWGGRAAVVGFLALGWYEWGPGNETTAPLIGGQTLDVTKGPANTLLAGAITGGFVGAQQLLSGYFARRNAQEFPRVSQTAYQFMNTDTSDESPEGKYKHFEDLPTLRKFFYAMSLGSSFTVTREKVVDPESTDSDLKRVSRVSAFITASTVSVVAASADVINQQFPDNSSVQFVMDRVISNPLVWIGAMVGILVKDKIFSRKAN